MVKMSADTCYWTILGEFTTWKNDAQKILCPRIVWTGQTPETGCHFILWVFDKTEKQIRIYHNTEHYISISASDMNILRDAFRNTDSLDAWTVCSLRVYHASRLVENLHIGELQPKKTVHKAVNTCMAQDFDVCIFQKIRTKTMHPDVKSLQWIQCDSCNKWLHYKCAGIDPVVVTDDMPFNCGLDIVQPCPYEKFRSLVYSAVISHFSPGYVILTSHPISKDHPS
ncbi:uncharacterized protein LOC130221751 isoform X2 [Danio aesculapii]|uniref:uncharacterized protein LOC130221751 isoform X2 n=1 Tax=Danio aesculapii TaxID=1142201 RepID=UPI0024C03AB4|nr:uncharacterized protein LOC130221751 isoform X2 [Danio aesculapii]